MPSKAQNRATAKYKKANYKRVSLEIPINQAETLKAVSAAIGESVNGFIKAAIRDKITADAARHGLQPDQYIAEAIKALQEKDQHAEDQTPAEDQTEDQHAEMDAETAGRPQDERKERKPMRIS